MTVLTLVAQAIPVLESYPEDWRFYPADGINRALDYMVSTYAGVFDGIKKGVNFFVLLPIKLGLIESVRPISWGFEFTPLLQSLYWTSIALLAAKAYWAWTWRGAATVTTFGTFLFFGLSNTAWPVFFAVIALFVRSGKGFRPLGLRAGLPLRADGCRGFGRAVRPVITAPPLSAL